MTNASLSNRVFAVLSLSLLLATAAAAAHAAPAAPAQPALREELLRMQTEDQAVRQQTGKIDFEKWQAVDRADGARLKQIVDQFGWPTVDMVGKDGAHAAWLLAQHADKDTAFQLQVLALMEPLVRTGQAAAKDYAYLWDRTHYPQRYGTQGDCIAAGEWQPFEIDDIAALEERRRAVGLEPELDYIARFKTICTQASAPGIPGEPFYGRRTVRIGKPPA